ncbi:NADH:flavin oxidoreductase [Paenibacillus sp. GCM10012307]|uniref:NADH:flavin oxidoreductase n=1 Tax=Paenibacillus roseus TaxID=2798579 RepID=A0A934J0N6_9BACL|nr:NADH:flavin oxidoreductase [Paenibacillus roseus]MBJ6362672.1 NADH:flavin oxidoreductase [Paenibacillus roseus]
MTHLFTPFSAGNLHLSNRVVMAPMTRGFAPNGVPGDDVAAYYARRAANGVGLIVTEGTLIDHPAAGSNPNWPNFHGEEALSGWSKTVEAVHAAGGKIIPQLWHIGLVRKPGDLPNPNALPVGPSGLSLAGEQIAEPLTEAGIADLITAFAKAAADAKRIGFDGIEFHGAHGYLIDQFFWEKTNHRTDEYGGDLVRRTRFAVEVIKAARKAVGDDFPIVLRFSQWKGGAYEARLTQNPAELEQFLAPLTDAGVDIFHASTRRYWEPEFAGSSLNLAGWTKKLTGVPTITVGSVGLDKEFIGSKHLQDAEVSEFDRLLEMLDNEEFDLVAVGRALLTDPGWADKIRDQKLAELLPYSTESLKTLY